MDFHKEMIFDIYFFIRNDTFLSKLTFGKGGQDNISYVN